MLDTCSCGTPHPSGQAPATAEAWVPGRDKRRLSYGLLPLVHKNVPRSAFRNRACAPFCLISRTIAA